MADTSRLISVSGDATHDSKDTVTQVYRVQYDSIPTNYYNALYRAQEASGAALPQRRSIYAGSDINPSPYCTSLNGALESEQDNRAIWKWTVTFSIPPPGEQEDPNQNGNPLLRPPVFNVRYMEREKVIEEARNVQALLHGDGNGGLRNANTLGPIVNAAGIRPDEPQLDTERLEVIVIKRNFPSLASIVTRNRTFKGTTNSDTVQGYHARELRYLMTESEGLQYENNIAFWPGVTEILAQETTDLELDNVGYEYWDAAGFPGWVRVTDKNGDFMAEPINLKLDGDQGGDRTTTITYRYLEDRAYAPLFI